MVHYTTVLVPFVVNQCTTNSPNRKPITILSMHHQTLYGILYILIASGCYCRAGAVSRRSSQMTHLHSGWLHLSLVHETELTRMQANTHKHTQECVCLLLLSLRVVVHGAETRRKGLVHGRVITWPNGHDPVTSVCVDSHTHTQMNPLSFTHTQGKKK